MQLPSALTHDLLVRQLAWRIQEKAFGGRDVMILRLPVAEPRRTSWGISAWKRKGTDRQEKRNDPRDEYVNAAL
jgi:hypothetical protein